MQMIPSNLRTHYVVLQVPGKGFVHRLGNFLTDPGDKSRRSVSSNASLVVNELFFGFVPFKHSKEQNDVGILRKLNIYKQLVYQQ